MPDFSVYIDQRVFTLIPALWFITLLLKSTPHVPEWIIPWILLGLGIFCSIGIFGWVVNWETIFQGIAVSAINVLGNSLIQDTVTGFKNGKGEKKE